MQAGDAPSLEQRRQQLRRSGDPRPERTRLAIIAAIRDLEPDRSTPVTVADVARAAGVARSSFYTHFASLEQLAVEAFLDAAPRITVPDPRGIPAGRRRSEWERAQRNLIEYSHQTQALNMTVRTLPISHDAYAVAVRVVADAIRRWIEALPSIPRLVTPRPASLYLGAATIGLIGEWFHDETVADEEQLLGTLMELAPGWLFPAGPAEQTPTADPQ